jgi:hypothetical protein
MQSAENLKLPKGHKATVLVWFRKQTRFHPVAHPPPYLRHACDVTVSFARCVVLASGLPFYVAGVPGRFLIGTNK